MCVSEICCRLDAGQAGQRLDAALSVIFPALSKRARQRLWTTHTVRVNGKACPPGYMVRAGDALCVRPLPATAPGAAPPPRAWERAPHVLEEHSNGLFLYKPSGLHTESLNGRGGSSLEALLPDLCAESAPSGPQNTEDICLVNRLDYGTSGIVAAVRSLHQAQQWRRTEDAGLCEKHYLALLCGRLPAPLTVRHILATSKRRVTKVLEVQSFNPLRHTLFTPLGYLAADAVRTLTATLFPQVESSASPVYTLAGCTITKGARHQIRAHARHIGFPLWGDAQYALTASPTPADSFIFLLHHGALSLPGITVHCEPLWLPLLPAAVQEAVRAWLV